MRSKSATMLLNGGKESKWDKMETKAEVKQIPTKYKDLVDELQNRLGSVLKVKLRSEIDVDRHGMLEAEVFVVDSKFDLSWGLVSIQHNIDKANTYHYDADINAYVVPGVSKHATARLMPGTRSRRISNLIAGAVKEVMRKEQLPVRISFSYPMDYVE